MPRVGGVGVIATKPADVDVVVVVQALDRARGVLQHLARVVRVHALDQHAGGRKRAEVAVRAGLDHRHCLTHLVFADLVEVVVQRRHGALVVAAVSQRVVADGGDGELWGFVSLYAFFGVLEVYEKEVREHTSIPEFCQSLLVKSPALNLYCQNGLPTALSSLFGRVLTMTSGSVKIWGM